VLEPWKEGVRHACLTLEPSAGAGVLGWLVDKMEENGSVHDIFIFTIVGASAWESKDGGDGGVVKKLGPVEARLAKHGKRLSIAFANATFGLVRDAGFERASGH